MIFMNTRRWFCNKQGVVSDLHDNNFGHLFFFLEGDEFFEERKLKKKKKRKEEERRGNKKKKKRPFGKFWNGKKDLEKQ